MMCGSFFSFVLSFWTGRRGSNGDLYERENFGGLQKGGTGGNQNKRNDSLSVKPSNSKGWDTID